MPNPTPLDAAIESLYADAMTAWDAMNLIENFEFMSESISIKHDDITAWASPVGSGRRTIDVYFSSGTGDSFRLWGTRPMKRHDQSDVVAYILEGLADELNRSVAWHGEAAMGDASAAP